MPATKARPAKKTPAPKRSNLKQRIDAVFEEFDPLITQEFNELFDGFEREWEQHWEDDTAQGIPQRPVIDQGIDAATLFARLQRVPHGARHLAPALLGLNQCLLALGERPTEFNCSSASGAIKNLRQAMKTAGNKCPKFPPLESMELLDRQGVTHAQISKIWGICPRAEYERANMYAPLIAAELEARKQGKEHCDEIDWANWRDPRELEWEATQSALDNDEFYGSGLGLMAIATKLWRLRTAERPVSEAEAMDRLGVEQPDDK